MSIVNEVKEVSSIVYEVEHSLLENPNIKYNSLSALPNKTLINARHTSTGMTAVAYKDNVSGEIIIAYCGTNLSGDGFKDVLADTSIITKLIQEQAPDAVKFYECTKVYIQKYLGQLFIYT